DRLKALGKLKIDKVNVVIAPSKQAAVQHIANKHTINLRRGWAPLRQAYFYKSQLQNGKTIKEIIDAFPEHDIKKFVKMFEMHHLAKSIEYESAEIADIIHNERRFPITNLERMYNDPSVQQFLGISFSDEGRVRISVSKKDFEKAYKRLVEDVAVGNIDSRKYNKEEQRKEYVESLPKPKAKASTTLTSRSFSEVKFEKPKKSVVSRKKREPLIPDYIEFGLQSSSLRALYIELRDIDLIRFSNAAHDLLRTFLECSLVYYLKSTGEYSQIEKNRNHNPTLGEMMLFISGDKCKSINDDKVKEVVEHIRSDYMKPYSLARMNMINHNENWAAHEKEVRAAWNKIEALMKQILKPQK
ncbi:MAG TPA: hypothetical protein VEY71_07800, partial [Chitinophagales bacterium]|nr:hypothetical protein [Chitinophagales bacterium]